MWIEHTALSELMDFSKKFYRDSYHKDMARWPPPNLWRCDFPFILLQILNQDQVIRYAGASTARLSNKRIVGHGQELARKELWSWAAQQLRSRTDSRHYLLVLAGGPTWNPKSEICRQERNLNSTFCMSLARTQPAVKGRSPILKSSSAFSPPLHTKKKKKTTMTDRFKNLMKYSLNDRFMYFETNLIINYYKIQSCNDRSNSELSQCIYLLPVSLAVLRFFTHIKCKSHWAQDNTVAGGT